MRKCFVSILLGGLLSAGSASASTIQATFNNVSLYANVGVSVNNSISNTASYQNFTARAGVLNWTRTGGDYASDNIQINDSFDTFCVELTQYINYGKNYSLTVEDLSDVPQPGPYPVGNHLGEGMGDAAAGLIQTLWQLHRSEVTTNLTAAAFQVAIWEIVYDSNGSLDITKGDFKVTTLGDVSDKAQTWLNSLAGYQGPSPILSGLSDPRNQDQVFYDPPTYSPPIVPAPASIWGAGLLLGSLVFINLRRKSKEA